MPGYKQLAQEVGDQVTSAMKPIQDITVDVVSSVAETVADFIPGFPVSPSTPEEVTGANFGLAEQLLSNQKSYVSRLLKAIEPITGKFVDSPKAKKVTAA